MLIVRYYMCYAFAKVYIFDNALYTNVAFIISLNYINCKSMCNKTKSYNLNRVFLFSSIFCNAHETCTSMWEKIKIHKMM